MKKYIAEVEITYRDKTWAVGDVIGPPFPDNQIAEHLSTHKIREVESSTKTKKERSDD